jgi:hypothetical protein
LHPPNELAYPPSVAAKLVADDQAGPHQKKDQRGVGNHGCFSSCFVGSGHMTLVTHVTAIANTMAPITNATTDQTVL